MAVIVGSAGAAHASEVDVTSVVDVTDPTTSVTLAPGGTGGAITINLSVTGNHAGTATFEVYRDWNLSGGQFTGSNPEEFTVPPRAGGDPATTFTASGVVTVASGHANGTFALTVKAFDITNSNLTGGKLEAGDSATYSVTVQASTPTDTTGPVVTCTPSASDGVWHATNQSVSCGATDSSGLSSSTPTPQTLSTNVASGEENPSAQTGTYRFCDTLNNCTTAGPITGWKIDRKAPSITDDGPTTLPNAADWYNTDVTNTFSASDGGSGLAAGVTSPFTKTTTGEGREITVASGAVADAVGNSNAGINSEAFQIDKTDPTAGFAGGPEDGGTYWSTNVPTVDENCGDIVSGIAVNGCVVSGYSTAAGTHTVKVTATDKAGNTAESSRTYTVRDMTTTGFYSPVDMGGVLNTVKGGSTVPLKFNILIDGVQQTDTALVTSFQTVTVPCAGGAPTDDIENLSTGGTVLRYDTSGGQFIQNWKTPTGPGTCRKAIATLADGDTIEALFKLK